MTAAVVLLVVAAGAVFWWGFSSRTSPEVVEEPAAATEPTPDVIAGILESKPPQAVRSSLAGRLLIVGSDVLLNAVTLWAEELVALHPQIQVEVEGKGGPRPETISRQCHLAPLHRPLHPSELARCRATLGYEPLLIRFARQSVAVVVHEKNRVSGLSLEQIDAMFSTTRKRGATEAITTWQQLGLDGEWARKLTLYGCNAASGTYGFFKEVVLARGDFEPSVREMPSSSSVMELVAGDPSGIGYLDFGRVGAGVRVVPIAVAPGDAYHRPSMDTCEGEYPLVRPCYLAINQQPGRPLEPVVAEFLRIAMSPEGQAVLRDGRGGVLPLRTEEYVDQWNLLERTFGR